MPEITLEPQYVVQFEAIDPATGAAVTGVTVSNVSITTLQAASFEPTKPVGPFQLIPLDDLNAG